MKTIAKKEIRTYMTTMSGYVLIAFMLFAVGIYFTAYHLAQGYPKFSATMSSCEFMFLIIIPILTMRSLAGEERQKTDQMLLTSPLSIRDIVLGKFFGMLAVFAIAIGIVCLYPPILTLYGTVNLRAAYVAILGYFLMGAACIAIGLFISSLTSNPVIAAVITFGVIFLLYMMSGIKSISDSTAFTSYIAYFAIIVALAILIFVLMKDAMTALIAGAAGEAAITVLYFKNPTGLEGSVQTIMDALDITSRFTDFADGVLDLKNVIYYIGVAALFLVLTIFSVGKRRWN
ncbi:MAG: ABC transporter permease [Lachnospiraceae bacterium]|jgi:ABC-2 type transport system permease protein|nr:ABC transporter permease [Lachnospiraceae bacterium]